MTVWCYKSEQAHFNSQGTSFFIQTLFKEGILLKSKSRTVFATGQRLITKSASLLCLKQLFREPPTPALLRVRFKTGTHLYLQSSSEHAGLPAAINTATESQTEGRDSRPC